jgi:hypothetical protein
MSIATGVDKKVILAPQVTQGTVAVVDLATAQYMRRVTSGLDLTKETYQSNEIRTDQQVADFRHGVRSSDGPLNGELSPGTYNLIMAAILRKDWVAAPVGGPESDIECAIVSGASATFTSAVTATFLQDGIKVGDVGRWTGWTTTGEDNNDRNFLVTAVVDLILTGIFLDGNAADAKIAGDAVTFTGVGKKTWTPTASHTNDWFTIEHNFSDIDLSEVFYDCKPNTMSINLPPSGMATIDMGFMGLNYNALNSGASPYFTAVLAASTGGVLAAVNGALIVEGVQVALLTGLSIEIAANLTSEPVVGSNVKPDLFNGKVMVTGNMTVFFEDATFRDYFDNETEVTIAAAFTTGSDGDADFMAFTLPRVKVGGAAKDDGEKGIVQTMPFTALIDINAGADTGATATDTLATTLSIQDSTVA